MLELHVLHVKYQTHKHNKKHTTLNLNTLLLRDALNKGKHYGKLVSFTELSRDEMPWGSPKGNPKFIYLFIYLPSSHSDLNKVLLDLAEFAIHEFYRFYISC